MTKLSTQFSGKSVLVLGGLGFIGSNLVQRLVKLEANVTVIDCSLPFTGANKNNLLGTRDKIRIRDIDIRETELLTTYLEEADFIFCAAGQPSHTRSMAEPMLDFEINTISLVSIINLCKKINSKAKIVRVGTRQVYGKVQYLPVNESCPVKPTDFLGVNNLATDLYFSMIAETSGVQCLTLRFTNIYGPRIQLRGDFQGVLGIFLRKALTGKKIEVYGDGTQIRDFLFIDDAVEALLLSAAGQNMRHTIYNVGSGQFHTLLQFIECIGEFIEVSYERVDFPLNKKVIDIGNYASDYSRFEADTGWGPKTNLKEGVDITLNFYRQYKHLYV